MAKSSITTSKWYTSLSDIKDRVNSIGAHRLLFVENPKTQFKVPVYDHDTNSTILTELWRNQLFDWCNENCVGRFWVGLGFATFDTIEDATAFKLTWLK